jgi:hypothetical protein
MNKNLNIIAKELFSKIRTQFPNVKMGDENSKITSKPAEARFFEFDYMHNSSSLGRITVSINADVDDDVPDGSDELVVIYSNDIIGDKPESIKRPFFNFLKELREFAKQHLLSFDTRDITKSNLEKRDYKFLSNNHGEPSMSESKLFGTSKTSYQNMGEAKIIVKHSAPVNLENAAGRAQRIESIYIENSIGERFKYPQKHLNGARALACHVSHGGNPYDGIGQHITGLSEELSKLRMFKKYVGRNDMVSEAMGAVNSKVIARIESVKKEIHQLQSPTRYVEFAESFKESDAKVIPEDVMNDWIDRLTVRTFNEELKNVFPYIFKLIDESDIPVKLISAEDLVTEMSEEDCDTCDAQIPEVSQYERHLNSIVEGDQENPLFGEHNEDMIAQLNHLIAEPIAVGEDGTNAIESLQDILGDDELMDIFRELADISPEMDVRSILKDYIAIKDEEHGTDVSSQLTFSEGESEQPPPAPAPEPMPEPAMPAAPAPMPPMPAAPMPAPAPVMASIDNNGSRIAETIRRAIKAGMKLEDTFKAGGKVITLKDAMDRAGMQSDDFFRNNEQELIEFVKSMYNTDEGSFPKGETGVLIACQKKFGEECTPMASKVIGKLHAINEMDRMKQLAGMR